MYPCVDLWSRAWDSMCLFSLKIYLCISPILDLRHYFFEYCLHFVFVLGTSQVISYPPLYIFHLILLCYILSNSISLFSNLLFLSFFPLSFLLFLPFLHFSSVQIPFFFLEPDDALFIIFQPVCVLLFLLSLFFFHLSLFLLLFSFAFFLICA